MKISNNFEVYGIGAWSQMTC